MSQLPELEVIRRDLERDLVGKRVKDATVRSPALVARHRDPEDFATALAGRRIGAVERRGVHLVLALDGGDALVVKPGEHGSLTRESAAAKAGSDTQLVVALTTGGALHYTDPGGGGEVFLIPAAELAGLPELAKLGIDPLADTFTWLAFGQELVRRAVPLKTLLLDPSFVVGLGDSYSDEVLWAAGLSPGRPSASLSSQEVRRLYRALLEVVHEAIKQRTADGVPAQPDADEEDVAEGWLKVWAREGLPCTRCRQSIHHESVVEGSTSYYCRNCQT